MCAGSTRPATRTGDPPPKKSGALCALIRGEKIASSLSVLQLQTSLHASGAGAGDGGGEGEARLTVGADVTMMPSRAEAIVVEVKLSASPASTAATVTLYVDGGKASYWCAPPRSRARHTAAPNQEHKEARAVLADPNGLWS